MRDPIMTRPTAEPDSTAAQGGLLVDPRRGDVEDDASSPGQRSLLAIAGSLLVEISLPKLLFAWTVSLLLPAVLLGLAPLVATAWFSSVSEHVLELTGISAALVLVAVVALGWFGWRPLFRVAETNFWSLNALAVQPGYAFGREALRHLAELIFGRNSTAAGRAGLRAATSAGAGIMLCLCATAVAILIWPASRWVGNVSDLVLLHRLIVPTLANAVVLVSGYLAFASLTWGFADATHGSAARSRRVRRRRRPVSRPGVSRIFQTFTWSVSDMASASRADVAARAEISALQRRHGTAGEYRRR